MGIGNMSRINYKLTSRLRVLQHRRGMGMGQGSTWCLNYLVLAQMVREVGRPVPRVLQDLRRNPEKSKCSEALLGRINLELMYIQWASQYKARFESSTSVTWYRSTGYHFCWSISRTDYFTAQWFTPLQSHTWWSSSLHLRSSPHIRLHTRRPSRRLRLIQYQYTRPRW